MLNTKQILFALVDALAASGAVALGQSGGKSQKQQSPPASFQVTNEPQIESGPAR